MAYMATVSSKGQLVIPASLRRKCKLKSGTRVALAEYDGKITITPDPFSELLALRGLCAGMPLLEDLAEERRKWDKRLESM